MGAQVLQAIFCWALLSQASGDQKPLKVMNPVNSSVIKDSASAGSGFHNRLYSNFRLGPYAAPYGAYSQQYPVSTSQVTVRSGPQVTVQNPGVFKDSYGKFVQPQMAYNTHPQQFVQIQALPPHLSQPLAADSPVFQYKTAAPHFFAGPQYKFSSIPSSVAPTSIANFAGQPQSYSESVKSFAPPSTYYSYGSGFPTTYVTSSPNIVHSSTTTVSQKTQEQEQADQKTQNLEETPQIHKKEEDITSIINYKVVNTTKDAKPSESHQDSHKTQTQTRITAIVNGEPTTVTLDTKPPLPLLDISLLEPLTFDNPLVTQMQHFLPKIEYKLPEFDLDDDNNEDDIKQHQKEVIIEHISSYDTGVKKPKKPKTKPKPKPNHVSKPKPPRGPELVYEINTPNGKEIYKEEVISYNKETKPEPVHYSYNDKSEEKPKVYSYVHNSQDPFAVTRVNYHSNSGDPKHHPSSGEQGEESDRPDKRYRDETDDSEESSAEPNNDGPIGPQTSDSDSGEHESYQHHPEDEHSSEYHHENHDHGDSPRYSHTHSELREKPKENYRKKNVHGENLQTNQKGHKQYKEYKQQSKSPKLSEYKIHPSAAFKPQNYPKKSYKNNHHSSPQTSHYPGSHHAPKQSQLLKVEHREQNTNPKHQVASIHPVPLQYFTSQPLKLMPTFAPVIPEWMKNMRILKPQKSHAAIKVDPNQHIQFGPTTPRIIRVEHTSAPQKAKLQHTSPKPNHLHYKSHPTHVHEKSKKIIIKDETPEELHMHAERMMEQMIGREENNEEDFEKAYKMSAFGFPGYEETEDEIEKEIFNPDSYGVPHEHLEYNIDDNPFEKYQKEGDVFPKSARLSYKDSADNTKEDYVLDYSVSKPESFLDHHKHKADYYKTYKNQRPKKIFTLATSEKPERLVAAVAAPSYLNPKQKPYFAKFIKPVKMEIDYTKPSLYDNAAFQSLPTHYRYRTSFVEPQFQFGAFNNLRPVVLHLDSELAAVASNNSPQSEKPTRKKLYKENWYIKKTTTGGAKNR